MRGGKLLFVFGLILTLLVPGAFFQWIGRSLILLVAFAKLYSVLSRKFISLRRDSNDTLAYRSENLEISTTAQNLMPLPVPAFLVADEPASLKTADVDRKVFSLLAGSGRLARLSYHVKGQARGKYFVGPLTVFSSDPLGFFPWWRVWHDSCAVTILPQILPLSLLFSDGVPLGELATSNPMYEDPGRLRSFREYSPGDDPRRIQWKISAKSGHLQVANYFPTISVPALILVNLNPADYAGKRVSSHSERAIIAAASAVQHWSETDAPFALVSNGYEPAARVPDAVGRPAASARAVAGSSRARGPGAAPTLETPGAQSGARSPAQAGGKAADSQAAAQVGSQAGATQATAQAGGQSAAQPTTQAAAQSAAVFPPEIRKFAFGKGRPHAALLLRHLAVLSRPDNGLPAATTELLAAGAELVPGPGCVVVYIGPGLTPEAYEEARVLFSGQKIEFWILDEQVADDGRIRSLSAAAAGSRDSRRSRFRAVREFGDEVFGNVQ